jgi:ribosome-binding factor A
MASGSPSYLIKQLATQMNQIVRRLDRNELSSKDRTVLAKTAQDLATARVYASAYELSETREEQLENTKAAKKWLNLVNKNLLAMSHIFSAIDTAHMTAQIDLILSKLE